MQVSRCKALVGEHTCETLVYTIGLKRQSLEIDQSALECNYNVNNQIMSW